MNKNINTVKFINIKGNKIEIVDNLLKLKEYKIKS